MNNPQPPHPKPGPVTAGAHHLGLTVPNLNQAVDFFVMTLGFELLEERPAYPAAFVSDGTIMLTLWQAQIDPPTPFDRKKNLGLHHFALRLRPGVSLEDAAARVAAHEAVDLEFSPEPIGTGPYRHIMFKFADAFRMEIVGA